MENISKKELKMRFNKPAQSTLPGACVLFQNKKYSIECYWNSNIQNLSIVVVIDQFYTDFPIIYDNGNVAFDNPERIPNYIKEKVKRYLTAYYNTRNIK